MDRIIRGRLVMAALVIAAAANVLLWTVDRQGTVFTKIISIASAFVVVGVLGSRWLKRLLNDALLLSFGLWVANTLEFASLRGIQLDSQVRQGGFYMAFAFLSLGAYVARRSVQWIPMR